MDDVPLIYISATRKDLSSAREAAADVLLRMGCMPIRLEGQLPFSGSVDDLLNSRIEECDAVIHIIGKAFGSSPSPEGDFAPQSYAQREYSLAKRLGKPVYTFICADNFPFDSDAPEPEDVKLLQRQHKESILKGKQIYRIVDSIAQLREGILALKPLWLKPGRKASLDSCSIKEGKLIMLGNAGAGKTSIVNRLANDQFEPTVSSHDISITQLPIKLEGGEDALLHIWDFGGQEIMHAMHRFFLAPKSLYLVVLSSRDDRVSSDADYWLRSVACYAGPSPVIIVLNKGDDRLFDVDRHRLMEAYPSIRAFVVTDCRNGFGINDLKSAIEKETSALPHIHQAFPASWFAIKDRLSSMASEGIPYIRLDSFGKVCAANGVSNPRDQEILSESLNTLGLALSFTSDPRLKAMMVLSPSWLTSGIYQILRSSGLHNNGGVLSLNDLERTLGNGSHPKETHLFLLDLMSKFELAFEISTEHDRRFLVPEALRVDSPPDVEQFKTNECLTFEYHYDFFPESILPRLIVRTYVLSEGMPRWRNGVILAFDGCQALVTSDSSNRICRIQVKGQFSSRRSLLAIVRFDFEIIHKTFHGLRVIEMVSVPSQPRFLIAYEKLAALEARGIRTFTEFFAGKLIELDTQDLLYGIDIDSTHRGESTDQHKPVSIFISYAHSDEIFRQGIETQLKLLKRQGVVASWHDRRIEVGDSWDEQIDKNLEAADIVLLLVSPDFLASDYFYEKEVARALERHKRGSTRVIPIILRDADWRSAPFSGLQVLPAEGRPIALWPDKDSAWKSVASGLRKSIEHLGLKSHTRSERALFVSSLSLRNIRCFEDVTVDLSSESDVRMFSLLFGNNGSGKTTLLRCLAAGLCDTTAATALLEAIHGEILRKDASEGIISIEVMRKHGGRKWKIVTTIRRVGEGRIEVEQKQDGDFPRDDLFLCGYGAGRRTFGTRDYPAYSSKDAVSTLFDYDASLQSPELAFRRAISRNVPEEELTRRIDAVLMLDPGATRIDNTGITIHGQWGDFVPAGALGDGFQSMLAWVADLLGWSLLHEPESRLAEVCGIVLVDEIEQHLHPQWQREIVRLLSHQFPNVQFIATSHAPMCALGMTSLPEVQGNIVRLLQRDGRVEATQSQLPFGKRADDVLTSPLFGLFSASAFDVSSDIQKVAQLNAKLIRTAQEDAELREITDRLDEILSPFQKEYQRRIESRIREALQLELTEALSSGQLSHDVLNYELRQRLAKVF